VAVDAADVSSERCAEGSTAFIASARLHAMALSQTQLLVSFRLKIADCLQTRPLLLEAVAWQKYQRLTSTWSADQALGR